MHPALLGSQLSRFFACCAVRDIVAENFLRHLSMVVTEAALCVRMPRRRLLHRTPCTPQRVSLTRACVCSCRPAMLRRDASQTLLDLVTW